MAPKKSYDFSKHALPNWKPVASLEGRKPGMSWSDRIWHWVVSLAGLAIMGIGGVVFAYVHLGRLGGWLVGVGFVVFLLGIPSQAVRNGYRTL